MKTIIEMAREAGLIVDANQSGFDSVEAFAALVRADEREECAKVCADLMDSPELIGDCHICIDAIRARGNT